MRLIPQAAANRTDYLGLPIALKLQLLRLFLNETTRLYYFQEIRKNLDKIHTIHSNTCTGHNLKRIVLYCVHCKIISFTQLLT
jgi:hypothetical protein